MLSNKRINYPRFQPCNPNGNVMFAQYARAFAISPSDTLDLSTDNLGCALYCNVDMTIKLILLDSEDAVTLKLIKGYHPLQVKKVYSTGSNLGGETLIGLK